ncbi:MAG: hypothetical protein II036_00030, partial [Oscillospiraceae bacterium]|nr:hypothetical protein [Oscillospiraceae bacterium]
NPYFEWDDGNHDEKYIYVSGTESGYVYGGADIVTYSPIANISGASYNSATNTLTLTNFSCSWMEVNLMGNGFKINLVGESHIGRLVVWGFMYGGSVTFTGSGSLYLNEGGSQSAGLMLQAENSMSCVMVNPGCRIESWGADAAIAVLDSTCEKGLYYLKGMHLEGGTVGTYTYDVTSTGTDGTEQTVTYGYQSVVTEDGTPSKHIILANAQSENDENGGI